jgi:hypothetical protein
MTADLQSQGETPLTPEEKVWAFRKATSGFEGGKQRWMERAATGMSDDELAEALQYEIGIFGGQCGPGQIGITYQGNGLKIWADRSIGRSHDRAPILSGKATVAFARMVYGIREPRRHPDEPLLTANARRSFHTDLVKMRRLL